MSVLYDIVQRQVILRANQLGADSSTALQTAYIDADIDQTNMGDRAIEFPFQAINDAILNAGDRMVRAIGQNPESTYRTYFADVTGSLASGAVIPTTSTNTKPVIGQMGVVKDASSPFRKHTLAPFQIVQDYNVLKTNILKVNPYLYFTDNTRIWHTSTNIVADVVVWSKTDQATLMVSTPTRGTCPFPEDLIEPLVCGALSYIFRGSFNNAQVGIWNAKFQDTLQDLNPNQTATQVASE